MFQLQFRLSKKVCRVVATCALAAVTTATAVAQQPVGRTELIFLGTAGGPPLRLDRSEPATLLIVDGRPYLIDCGIGTMRRMLQAGIASETIQTIFLTYLHADHDLGLADVMANDFFRLNSTSSTQHIELYGPPQTEDLVDAAFHYIAFGFQSFAAEPGAIRAGLVDGRLISPFVAHDIQHEGLIYQDDKIRVIAAENSHYALMPPEDRKKMKSYSYRIETPHGIVVFTGDTGPSGAVTRLAAGADVLVVEVEDLNEVSKFVQKMAAENNWPPQRAAALMAHMRQEHLGQTEVGKMVSAAQVKSVVLYHYDPEDPSAYVAAIKSSFAGAVFASADLDRYCLGTPDALGTAGALFKCGTGSSHVANSNLPR
ncbi:MBL fold metallo-hydrolase [Alloacidobacterium sp.]|uniref:MBL fold metallo-hydrolase n=1 Tax=Alloacidobacterium sp. TaxID=2951999 RepID=UPI002D59E359|nr:MBL fold metallo-hydrolase [Alloacidobacterium sp.]HYK37015.1 MBL fold metallo-hydrolase [Alloacidobacterium sp.]